MKTENEIIAEFMGSQVKFFEGVPRIKTATHGFNSLWRELKYDTSWDWLMPVVEKIESKERVLINMYGDATKIWVDDCDGDELFATSRHGVKDNKIGHVYRAVVDFIKWYNSQPK